MSPKHKSWSEFSDWLYRKHPELWDEEPKEMKITITYSCGKTEGAMVPSEFPLWDRERKENLMNERFPGWVKFEEY